MEEEESLEHIGWIRVLRMATEAGDGFDRIRCAVLDGIIIIICGRCAGFRSRAQKRTLNLSLGDK